MGLMFIVPLPPIRPLADRRGVCEALARRADYAYFLGMKRSLPIAFVAAVCAFSAIAPVLAAAGGTTARLLFLDIRGGRVVSMAPDGTDQKVLVTGLKGTPDGIVVDALDVAGDRMYFTDLGGNAYTARLDGSDRKTLLIGQGSR
jgi:hypothetical protein